MNEKNPLVSIIITTKNEQENIAACLESVKKQEYPSENMEMIVVDNNSQDKTKEISREFTSLVFSYGPERSAQRNFGVNMAHGKYVMYLDADMTLNPELIKECVERMEKDKSLVALYVPEIIKGKRFFSKIRKFERSFYDATAIDAVRFLRKDIFLTSGGFDEELTGPEDWDLDKKIRALGKTDIAKNFLYHNEENLSLSKYFFKKSYYGQDFEKYIRKWGASDPDIRKQFGFTYRFWGVFTERGKWKQLLSNPFLAFGMYALKVAVGINYICRKKQR